MNLKILSWNCRGLGNTERQRGCRRLISENRPDLAFVQETKLERCSREFIRKLWGDSSFDWAMVDSIGSSGDLLAIWDADLLQIREVLKGAFSLSIQFQMISDNSIWSGTNIYGPCDPSLREHFWEELYDIAGWVQSPWVLAGDFNVVRHMNEKKDAGGGP